MIKFTTGLYVAMNEALGEIAITSDNTLQRAERSYQVALETMQEVKDYILNYTFKDKQEEILFFKEIKPQFLSTLVYHNEVFYLEAGKPIGNKEVQANYYNQALHRINVFFERNKLIYVYYRMGKTNFDEEYFIRNSDSKHFLHEYTGDIDPRFSTVQSLKYGKMQAYEYLTDFLQQTLHLLENPGYEQVNGKDGKFKNLWTDTKSSLIELAYAIHSRGAVNNGKGDVKQVIADLEMVFNVQLGNFYRTFQSMRIRKKNRTPFLDTLKESLEKRMNDTDLNF